MKYNICTKNDIKDMCYLWNEEVASNGFFKPYTTIEYEKKLLTNPDFSYEGIYIAKEENNVIGFSIGYMRKSRSDNPSLIGYLNAVVVKKQYRNQGIGTELLRLVENYFIDNKCEYSQAAYYLPSCYSWYIPNTDHHDHPCAPGIRINSPEYFYLLHQGYVSFSFEDAFHLPLADYQLTDSINNILKENEKNGLSIELYDANKHYGLEDFYKELNIYDFEKVIRANLAQEIPYPFLIISQNGKVVGWTGAMWNEESGRGHFDGIAILSSVRGRGLGKALFSLLAYNSKQNGAKFMTFYTGLNNHARYIYMGAGFKIVQSFALMRKALNK